MKRKEKRGSKKAESVIQSGDRFERNPDVVHRRMKEDVVLLPVRPIRETERQFYFCEEVGGRIWELLDGRRRCQGIVETIASEFGENQGRIRSDVLVFLKDLEREGLIRRVR